MRRRRQAVVERDTVLLEEIRSIKADHPFWGYRRVWAHLRYIDHVLVNKKAVLRLMRENNLLVKPDFKPKAERKIKPKPRADKPNQWWGIDMTKVMTASGWVYLVIVLDWHTKKVVGHYAGMQALGRHWLIALEAGLCRQFPGGVRGHQLHLMSDNGSQPTSVGFMKATGRLGISQAFTSYNNPKGNADTERMMRTLKEELLWLREWNSSAEVIAALDIWIESYNRGYLHSALSYRSPEKFEEDYNLCHKTTYQST
jgi:transposase InsO family protein